MTDEASVYDYTNSLSVVLQSISIIVACLGVYSAIARIIFLLYYTPTIATQPHVVHLPVNIRLY